MGSVDSAVCLSKGVFVDSEWQFEINDDFQHLDIVDLVTYQPNAPPRLRHEILLLSWLLVLVRTHGTTELSFGWNYRLDELHEQRSTQASHTLSAREFFSQIQDNVSDVARRISSGTKLLQPTRHEDSATSTSILLATLPHSDASCSVQDMVEIRHHNHLVDVRIVRPQHGQAAHLTRWYINTWIDMVKLCISHSEISLEVCLRSSKRDLDEIWSWNLAVPPTHDQCMHDIIARVAGKYPNKDAISSWDGRLTYSQVDEYSTNVAHLLKRMNLEPKSVIPVCFEKSRWTVVTILGVMKAGATFVLLDPTIPLSRLQDMVRQVNATMVITSETQQKLSESILPGRPILVVNEKAFYQPRSMTSEDVLPPVSSDTLLYIIFTSGSTGTPKGVMISHQTYTSSAIPRAEAVGYDDTSRVLDFASYAFDVSIDSMLCTLSKGGCLCIPSEEDRMNDLNKVMRDMQITYAGLTPSVARILDQEVVSSLDCLGLGGEAVTASHVAHLGRNTRIVIGYGPCECTIGCTINSSAARGQDYISIGKGNGAVIWIVDPDNPDYLSPVGSIGELWVEGPIVGQGYLNDEKKTAEAFVDDPPWLLAGHKQYPGRRGRLYKTGDLVRYDLEGQGDIVFVGRKDTQVKLRGQRVELGEIEWQLRTFLPADYVVTAEVVSPSGEGRQPMLVAFVAPLSTQNTAMTSLELVETSAELSQILSDASAKLAKVLPRYMVPTIYVSINRLPVLISGKTDRKLLRHFGATMNMRSLERQCPAKSHRALNEKETILREAWRKLLDLKTAVEPDDNFFAIGGDSVAAMKLVSICREKGYALTVANAFLHPTLAGMAVTLTSHHDQTNSEMSAFELVSCEVETARFEAAQICNITPTAIEDIYPCTPTQQSLFTFSLKSLKSYVAQRVFEIPCDISIEQWKQAWEVAISMTPMLRIRLYRSTASGLDQVVVRESISWAQAASLTEYCEADRAAKIDLGQSLARYAIIEKANDARRYMVWTVHHVLYDGWSEPRFLNKVYKALRGEVLGSQPQFKIFVRYLSRTGEDEVQDFWRKELKGAIGPQFPQLPSRHYVPKPDATIEHRVSLESGFANVFTFATLIRGAWALVSSQYTGSDDVVFCETFTGRDIPLAGVENIEGPMIATSPVRIRIDRATSVRSYFESIQRTVLARASYQHCGMQNIRKVSRDAEYACEARTGLVIQLESGYKFPDLGLKEEDALIEALHFNPYPLMLAFGIRENGFRVCANFDSSLISGSHVTRLLAQLETTFSRLTIDLSQRVDDISCLSAMDLDEIWRLNCIAPLAMDSASQRVRAGTEIESGSQYPPIAVGWVCDPRRLSRLSPIGTVGELWLETALTSTSTDECPAWLTAGSLTYPGREGKVQATGDLVKMQEDGRLVFIGRKENVTPIDGHAIDIQNLETQFQHYLASKTRIAAALYDPESTKTSAQDSDQKLVLFVEQLSHDEQSVDLLASDFQVCVSTPQAGELKFNICGKMSSSISEALRALDKYIRDTFQPYMVPYAYVVMDHIPHLEDQNRTETISQLVNKFPSNVIDNIRSNQQAAWIERPQTTRLSEAENLLLQAWAAVLHLDPHHIDVDDNFFRLGGDSILAMKLVSTLRTQGHILSVADLFQYTRLNEVAKVMRTLPASHAEVQVYRPFSLLDSADRDSFISDSIRPKLENPNWSIKDILPITNTQALDIRATIQAPRTSIQYTMLRFDHTVERERLIKSCNELTKIHDILRTVFVEHKSSFLQVVIDQLNIPIIVKQADTDLETFVSAFCAQDIELERRLGSSFFQMFYIESQPTEKTSCLIISLSHALYDGISLPKLLRDLEVLYQGGNVTNFSPFSSYMNHVHNEETRSKAVAYWRGLLDGSDPSVLSDPRNNTSEKSIFLSMPVDISCCPKEITMASLLTAAWSLVLARYLQKSDVTFGGVTSGRQINMTSVEDVMGPCYQFTPVRVSFDPSWTGLDLMNAVQQQKARSAAYDFLGFDTISQECTDWPNKDSDSLLSSLVHHQDFEDFDTMPFGEGTCKVEISNPHGDAAYPIKVVSFVQKGQMHAGIVGSENEPEFVRDMLNKLVESLQYLAGSCSDRLIIN